MFNRYLQDPRIMQTVAILLGIESEVADNEGIQCFEWNLFCKTTLKSSERAFWLPMKFIEIFLRLKKRHFKINFVMWHLKSLHHHHHQKKNQLVSQWKQKNHNQNLNQKLILQSKRLVCIWWMLWLRNVFFLLHLLLLLQMLSSLIATSNGLGIFLTSSNSLFALFFLQSLEEKGLGNAAYKRKDFETALDHYGKAIELDPTNMSFLTNRAGLFWELLIQSFWLNYTDEENLNFLQRSILNKEGTMSALNNVTRQSKWEEKEKWTINW